MLRAGLFLTTYCVWQPHVVSFLRNEISYSLLKTQKTYRLGGWSVLNVLNSDKWGVQIHTCALLLELLAFFGYTVRMPFCSRINPEEGGSLARWTPLSVVCHYSIQRVFNNLTKKMKEYCEDITSLLIMLLKPPVNASF